MSRYEKAAAVAVAVMLVAGAAIFFFAPTDALQVPCSAFSTARELGHRGLRMLCRVSWAHHLPA